MTCGRRGTETGSAVVAEDVDVEVVVVVAVMGSTRAGMTVCKRVAAKRVACTANAPTAVNPTTLINRDFVTTALRTQARDDAARRRRTKLITPNAAAKIKPDPGSGTASSSRPA
jgi:hypothetical protein